jgi:mono/diheme cytochrome c family protein
MRIDATGLLGSERDAFLDLLGSLSDEEWQLATECPKWTVEGVALHILGDDLSLLARQRDGMTNSLTLFAEGRPGLEIGQLNGDFGYAATGRTANQLTTLDAIDTLTPALTQEPAQLPVIPNPAGSAPLAERARAYLHSNCAYCHRPGGPVPSDMDLRYTTALNQTHACDITPTLSNLGISDPRLIAPGSAARSVVVARVNRTGADAMPPLARHTIDTAGVQLLTEWIDALTSCN